MSLIQYLQSVKEFVTEKFTPPRIIGKGRQCLDDRKGSAVVAEVRLNAPYCHKEAWLYPESLRDLVEYLPDIGELAGLGMG